MKVDRNKKRKWRIAYETWDDENGYLTKDDYFIGTFEEASEEAERLSQEFEEKNRGIIAKVVIESHGLLEEMMEYLPDPSRSGVGTKQQTVSHPNGDRKDEIVIHTQGYNCDVPNCMEEDFVVSDTVYNDRWWKEEFEEMFTDNPVFWSELVGEWQQGDVDVKPFLSFITKVAHHAYAQGVTEGRRKEGKK